MQLKPALLALLVILATAATSLFLMSLAEGIHLGRARAVLRALFDHSAGSLPV